MYAACHYVMSLQKWQFLRLVVKLLERCTAGTFLFFLDVFSHSVTCPVDISLTNERLWFSKVSEIFLRQNEIFLFRNFHYYADGFCCLISIRWIDQVSLFSVFSSSWIYAFFVFFFRWIDMYIVFQFWYFFVFLFISVVSWLRLASPNKTSSLFILNYFL